MHKTRLSTRRYRTRLKSNAKLVVILTNAAVFYSISRNPQAVTSSGEVRQIGAWVTIITLFVLTVNLEFKGNIKNKPTPAQPDEFRKAVAAANMAIVKGAVTAPRKRRPLRLRNKCAHEPRQRNRGFTNKERTIDTV